MENEMMMGNNGESGQNKKSLLPIIGIIAAAVIVIAIVAYAVATSPRALTATLIKNTPDAIVEFFESDKGETPLFMTESHQSETVLTMDGEELGLDGEIELEIDTGYQNVTGDLLAEMQLGLGDMDAITGGLYLNESELAIISSVLVEKYVIDLEMEGELGKETSLQDRLVAESSEDAEIIKDLEKRAQKKMEEYRKYAIKVLPKDTIEKTKDSLEILGKDKNTNCIEISLDEDDLQDWLELIFEKAAEDDELEDLIVDIVDYVNDSYNLEQYDTDEIDLEESMEDAIDELEYLEAEISVKIFYNGFKPIAYALEYEDEYDKAEALAQIYRKGNDRELVVNYEDEYDEFFVDFQEYANGESYVEYKIDDMSVELTMEKVRNGVYEISGSVDSGYGMKGDISGELVQTKNEVTYELEYDLESDYSAIEIKVESSIVTEGTTETVEIKEEMKIDGEDYMELSLELEKEQIKKNKEYNTKGDLKISIPDEGVEVTLDIENTTIYGSEVDVDMPNWSKDDVYAEISDEEALEEWLDALIDDFNNGISELLYGELY